MVWLGIIDLEKLFCVQGLHETSWQNCKKKSVYFETKLSVVVEHDPLCRFRKKKTDPGTTRHRQNDCALFIDFRANENSIILEESKEKVMHALRLREEEE